jgi:hypothetical protein
MLQSVEILSKCKSILPDRRGFRHVKVVWVHRNTDWQGGKGNREGTEGGGGPEMRQLARARDRQVWGFVAMYKEPPFQVGGFFLSKQFMYISVF